MQANNILILHMKLVSSTRLSHYETCGRGAGRGLGLGSSLSLVDIGVGRGAEKSRGLGLAMLLSMGAAERLPRGEGGGECDVAA